MNEEADHIDENDPSLNKESDRAYLRQLLLDGLASPLIEEPWDAHYFEKLREQIRERANEEISRQRTR